MWKLSATAGLSTCLALALAAPGPILAQEMEEEAREEAPPVLRLSFFQCHSNRIGDVMEEAETYVVPVWDELVDEGKVQSYGFFTHWWADEWNVGIYTVASSIEAVVEAEAEAAERLEERHPDAPDTMGEACPWHRDGFYVIGPNTGDDGEEDDGNGGDGG